MSNLTFRTSRGEQCHTIVILLVSFYIFPLKTMKGNKMTQKARNTAIVIVWLDLAVVVIHGLSHIGADIWLSFFGNTFVTLVIIVAPFVSLLLLHTIRLKWLGMLLLFLSMFGSFLFGVWNHFLVAGPDNVIHVPPGMWQQPFQVTAVLLTIIQAIGTGIGVWGLAEVMHAYILRRAEVAPTVREHKVKSEI